MSSVDEIIRERLRKLKCDEQVATSSFTSSKKEILNQPRKSRTEQVEDLLEQLSSETVLEDAFGKDKAEIDAQIRRRLDRLKEWELGPPRASFKEIGRLKSVPDVVNEVLSRPDFRTNTKEFKCDDQNSGKISAEEDESSTDDSDAPPNYCVFCKAEPTIVCIDCYKDSYCSKCFNEFHEPEDEHATYAYVTKKEKRGS